MFTLSVPCTAKQLKQKVYSITCKPEQVNFSNTLNGYKSGINASFYNLKTRRAVPIGLKNRPFIIKRNNEIIFSDKTSEILETDKVISAGSWLIKDSKYYSTNDCFSDSFKSAITNRTVIAKNRNGKILIIVITNSSFNSCRELLLNMGVTEAVALDGGSSSQIKINGKYYVTGKNVVNFVVIKD